MFRKIAVPVAFVAAFLVSSVVSAAASVEKWNIVGGTNLSFATSGSVVTPDNQKALASIAKRLNANPSVKITLIGYTDSAGTDKKNESLGKARAQAVKDALVALGVDASRFVEVLSKGAANPLGDNATEAGRQRNRRVELRVLALASEPASAAASAATPEAAKAAPVEAAAVVTPVPTPWYDKVTVGGYIDEYYQHSFNNPTAQNPNLVDRAFDGTANQFTFGGGELTLKQNDSASGTGYYVDLLLGSLAGSYNGANTFTAALNGTVGVGTHGHTFGTLLGTASGTVNNPDQVAIGQAYVTQAFGPLTATLGKFGTPVGYEVTYLPSNANFSRSLLFTQEPLFNTGLRLDYALPAGFTASGFIDDGNSTDGTISRGKDYGAVLAYAGIKNLSLTGVWYLNDGININGQLEDIEWGNLIASYTVSDSLSFAGEYLIKEYNVTEIGAPYNPIEQGYALYATYSPIANLSISPRFEQWANPSLGGVFAQYINGGQLNIAGFINTPTVLNDYTLTAKYQMGPLAHILEYRVDASNLSDAPFVTSNSKDDFNYLSNIQQTLTYAAVYSF